MIVNKSNLGVSSAATANADLFKYEITITGVSPTQGSLEGGTLLTLAGTNFSKTMLENQVLVGTKQDLCVVKSVDANGTALTCLTNKPATALAGA